MTISISVGFFIMVLIFDKLVPRIELYLSMVLTVSVILVELDLSIDLTVSVLLILGASTVY